jgi:deazaflavin-dependent oxidoreductase (nitroreductase family)
MATLAHRFWKAVGESGMWKGVGRVHAELYRLTGGRIGHSLGGFQNLLLTTRGRRSGAERTVPLTYLADGDTFVLVASNGGADRHPSWWLNLRAAPDATVQVGGRHVAVVAREANAEEHARLWPRLKSMNPFYGMYEQLTARRIPVVILRPVGR